MVCLNVFSSFSAFLSQLYFSAVFLVFDFMFSYSVVFLWSSIILSASFCGSGFSMIPPPSIISSFAAFSGKSARRTGVPDARASSTDIPYPSLSLVSMYSQLLASSSLFSSSDILPRNFMLCFLSYLFLK